MAGFDALINFAIQQVKSYARNLVHSFAGFLVVSTLVCMPSQGLTFETAEMKEPKSLLVQPRVNRTEQAKTTKFGSFLLSSVRFFQKQVSPIDGPRCRFSPTCSQFGYEAVHDHGPTLGIIMTADRLMRCSYWTEAGSDYDRLPNGALHDPVVSKLLK